jgi:hypothetical protein
MANIDKLIALAFSPSAFEGEAVNAFLAIRKNPKALEALRNNKIPVTVSSTNTVVVTQYREKPRYQLVVAAEVKDSVYELFMNTIYEMSNNEVHCKIKVLKSPSLFNHKWLLECKIIGCSADKILVFHTGMELSGAKIK